MNGNGAQGVLQVLAPHGFDNMVDAAILRQRQRLFSPVAFQAVDALAGPQLFGQRQLFIAPGRNNDLCAVRFCDLQGENRHAARSLYQHRLPGVQLTAFHQCEPGGKPRAG